MNDIEKAVSLLGLTFQLQRMFRDKVPSALGPDFLAHLEDHREQVVEASALAVKVSVNRSTVQVLDKLLGQKELENISTEAHHAILREKQALEKTICAQEKQLSDLFGIEEKLVDNFVRGQAAMEADRRGCLNSELAAIYVKNTSHAELQSDGSIKITFRDDDGFERYNRRGDPMTLGDAIENLADENSDLFAGKFSEATKQDNPWLPGKRNLTRQGEIFKSDPALAKQLQEQARTGNIDGQTSNPFLRGRYFNLTEAGRLLKENPEKAKRLAAEAGLSLDN